MNYLSYETVPTRVHLKQVTDTCQFLEQTSGRPVRLVIFLPLKNLKKNKQRIRKRHERAWVIPALFGIHRYRLNYILLFFTALFLNSGRMIACGPIAASLALRLKRRKLVRSVAYDAKGGYAAEWKQYQSVPFPSIIGEIEELERRAVLESDQRIAVSKKLVEYWRQQYQYAGDRHVIVPNTLDSNVNFFLPEKGLLYESRRVRGFREDEIILVYSGSGKGAQALHILDEVIVHWMEQNPAIRLLLLTDARTDNLKVIKKFPEKVKKDYVRSEKLSKVLATCDYGLLLREDTVANQVSSPTKFGEYLASGLPVIISPHLGDLSDFVQEHKCGMMVVPGDSAPAFERVSYEKKEMMSEIARKYFLKGNYWDSFSHILTKRG